MFGLEILDLALGMIFIYLLLSLMCTAIQEFIESFLKLRSVDLEQGIREMFQDYNGTGLAKQFYEHPVIFSLFRDNYDPEKIRNRNSNNNRKKRYTRGTGLPSYIPARTFSLAIMDMLKTPPATAAADNIDSITGKIETANSSAAQLAALRKNILNNPGLHASDQLKKAVLAVIDSAGGDVGKVRESLEHWYNSSMDRVSGWYKRRVHRIIFIMGLALTIAMNADSIAIFSSLANDKPLRDMVVAQVAAFHKNNPDSAPPAYFDTHKKELLKLGLPIGWGWRSDAHPTAALSNDKAVPPPDFYSWMVKALGWIATALAISLGAPFWFDMLNKVMVIRATVKPTEKSPNEASEDRQKK